MYLKWILTFDLFAVEGHGCMHAVLVCELDERGAFGMPGLHVFYDGHTYNVPAADESVAQLFLGGRVVDIAYVDRERVMVGFVWRWESVFGIFFKKIQCLNKSVSSCVTQGTYLLPFAHFSRCCDCDCLRCRWTSCRRLCPRICRRLSPTCHVLTSFQLLYLGILLYSSLFFY